MHTSRGTTFVEVLLVAGLLATLVGLSVPMLTTGRDATQLRGAARYVASRIRLARAHAARQGAAVGIWFVEDAEGYRFRTYVDGNDNGVRRADMVRGIDMAIDDVSRVGDRFPGVRIALGPAVPPINERDAAGSGADPIRFGGSDIVSVSPLGTATSGTVYLRSQTGRQAAVRVLGISGRVRVLVFDVDESRWRAR